MSGRGRRYRYRGKPRLRNQRRCTAKRKFDTEADGQVALEVMMQRNVYIKGATPMGYPAVYHCRRCSFFHIGHSWRNDAPTAD